MKFSLLVANYNNGKYFKDCYQSILAQTYNNWEVIIVDDASTDNSIELIQDLIAGDYRFKFFQNETNKGCGYTKRKCTELATGEFCGFLDPDDALLPHAIETILSGFQNNASAVLVHSNLLFCNEELDIVKPHEGANAVNNLDKYFFNFYGAVTAFAGFLRTAYVNTEGIDAYMLRAIDQDLYLKLAEVGAFSFVNEPLYLYRIHSRSISKNGNFQKAHYWHWFAVMQAAKRRNINIEDFFLKSFSSSKENDKLKKIMTGNANGKLYLFLLKKKIIRKFAYLFNYGKNRF